MINIVSKAECLNMLVFIDTLNDRTNSRLQLTVVDLKTTTNAIKAQVQSIVYVLRPRTACVTLPLPVETYSEVLRLQT